MGARAQAWQPCRPTAMKRKAGGVLHLRRILLAAAATASTCASAKTSCAAQGIFRAGNRQATAKKQIPVNPGPGRLCPKSLHGLMLSKASPLGWKGTGTYSKKEESLSINKVSKLGISADLRKPRCPCSHIHAPAENIPKAIRAAPGQR